jgi:DNA-3-methyladenine glycosylase I
MLSSAWWKIHLLWPRYLAGNRLLVELNSSTGMPMNDPKRCEWCLGHPLMTAYHDTEWGVPLHDDRKLFEFLVLDAAQAGLSWQTILLKRENYRSAFDGFDPEKIARYTDRRVKQLLANPGIIRNRLKVRSAITNARAFLKLQDEFGSFDRYVWQFVAGRPRINRFKKLSEIPAKTRESDAMSKDLQRRGFQFVGSTICYAFMQAAGMVNDHIVTCFRHREVQR